MTNRAHLKTGKGSTAAHPKRVRRASAEPNLQVCSMRNVARLKRISGDEIRSRLPLATFSSLILLALSACSTTEGTEAKSGEAGPAGENGENGENGARGEDGANGENGAPGAEGEEGMPGEDGENGAPGENAEGLAAPIEVHGVVTHEVDVAGAEMLAVSADGMFAVAAGADVATLLEIGRARLTVLESLTLPAENLPEGSTSAEFTGVSIHPSGDYALIAVKDNDDANLGSFDEVPGKLLAVSLPELEVLGEVTVGRGPDSVAISKNGEFAVVANEDEEDETDLTNVSHRAGSVSVVDLRSGPSTLTAVEVPLPQAGIPYFPHDPQPETVKIAPDNSFILATLQENNAISRIEVPSPLPEPFTADDFSVVNFDAGIRHGFGLVSGGAGSEQCASSNYDLSLRDEFMSAREPDGLAITADGSRFVTADEDNLTWLNAQEFEGEPLSAHGSRSISVYDSETGELLGDSGDTIEQAVMASQMPQRCSSKGPEPEVVTVGEILGRTLAFVAVERSDSMTIHDITQPEDIRLLDLVVLNANAVAADESADYEPEGIEFISGRNLVVVSNPAVGSVSLVELRLHAVTGGSIGSGSVDEPPVVDCGGGPLPGQDDIVLNEVSSNPNPDFVELFNNGASVVDLSGWKLIDNGDLSGAFVFPAGTTIDPGGILVIEGDGSPVSTALKLTFSLGSADQANLYTACDELVDSTSWAAHVITTSRCPDGTGTFVTPTPESKGALNTCL